jgi:hypothetical protein
MRKLFDLITPMPAGQPERATNKNSNLVPQATVAADNELRQAIEAFIDLKLIQKKAPRTDNKAKAVKGKAELQ